VIHDLHSGSGPSSASSALRPTASASFPPPSAFIYLHERDIFLTFHGSEMRAWDMQGRQVAAYGTEALCPPSPGTPFLFG
jgi:hypothetical protein